MITIRDMCAVCGQDMRGEFPSEELIPHSLRCPACGAIKVIKPGPDTTYERPITVSELAGDGGGEDIVVAGHGLHRFDLQTPDQVPTGKKVEGTI